MLLQSNALRQALQPYVLGGAHGKLLDADHDRLGCADVQAFEMEELMHSKAAALAVLRYLFARFEERLDGAPTLLILDEAWLFLDDPVFAARIRQWLKTLRKKNVSVIFATQSLADIKDSSIAPAIVESCVSRIFLPNPQATEPQIRVIYEGFGLNTRQIEIVATAQPKRDYYYQSRLGNRVFDLGLGPVTLAFAGTAKPEDQRAIDVVSASVPPADFAAAWLRHRGLDWAADLIPSFPSFPSHITSGELAMKKTLLAIAAAPSLMTAMPAAQAQWVVIDPTNLAQNILTAARTLEQINNQILQLQNEAQMLMNQARNLTSLDFSALNELRSALSATNQLIQQAQGLAFNVAQMETEFARLYPDAYTASDLRQQMATDARTRWRNSLEALRTATKVQSQAVQNFASDERTLTDLVNRSQSAVGACKPRRRRTSCWPCSPARRSRRSSSRSRRTVPPPWNRRGRSRCRSVRARCVAASRATARPIRRPPSTSTATEGKRS